MQRNFTVLLVVGLLMLTASPFVWRLNDRVHETRLDVDTAAYFMRADVLDAVSVGGFMCMASAIIALVQLRRARGKLAETKASLLAVPGLVFAVACFAKLVVVLPYVLTAYHTAPGFQTVSLTVRNYNSWTGIAQAIGATVFIFFVWPSAAFVYRNRRAA